tara:strand:+ start:3184 stop:4446 length:1263 start_codon:yes stop_codon:yes gene_type:complete
VKNKNTSILLFIFFGLLATNYFSQNIDLSTGIKNVNKLNANFSSNKKIEIINSKTKISRSIVSEKIIKNQSNLFNPIEFIDSLRDQLLKNKSVLVDYSKIDFINQIKFSDFQDTIKLADIAVLSPTGGVPLIYNYDVLQNDKIFYEVSNNRIYKLKSLEIKEGESSRFVKQNLSKKEFIKSSFVVTSDNKLSIAITNDNFIKNIGLLKSSINIRLNKLSNVTLKKEIIYDTIFTKKKVVETTYDTIFKIEFNNKYKIVSKLNLKGKNKITLPIIINSEDSLISWSYWIGLNGNDSIEIIDDINNPLSLFSVNELNNKKTEINIMEQLSSSNNDLNISFENYTLDRRSLNFSDNYSFHKVDNNFTNDIKKKAIVKISNTSTLYDFKIHFAVVSISLVPVKVEIEKDVGEVKKFMKLTLTGF